MKRGSKRVTNPFWSIRFMATAIFDALPYYDNDLEVHPDLRSKVEKELAREGKPPTTTLHPKVPPPIDLFSVGTSIIRFYVISQYSTRI